MLGYVFVVVVVAELRVVVGLVARTEHGPQRHMFLPPLRRRATEAELPWLFFLFLLPSRSGKLRTSLDWPAAQQEAADAQAPVADPEEMTFEAYNMLGGDDSAPVNVPFVRSVLAHIAKESTAKALGPFWTKNYFTKYFTMIQCICSGFT